MRVTYLSPLRVEAMENENTWRLLEDFKVQVDGGNPDPTIYIVPAGFMTDFASVPRLPLIYLWLGGKCHRAAVIHDWLYSAGSVSREYADEVFAAGARASGQPEAVVEAMYAGIRLGGESHFAGKKKTGPRFMNSDGILEEST